jgi:hypothetical protein
MIDRSAATTTPSLSPALGCYAMLDDARGVQGLLKGNVIKYLARTKNPNDLLKAQHYLEKLNSLDKPI